MTGSRTQLAEHVTHRLVAERDRLKDAWARSGPVTHFVVDDLMPTEDARAVADAFPDPSTLMQRRSFRERKRVGVDVSSYDPIVNDFLYAFQAEPVCAAIEAITGIEGLEADPSLYASGLSVMSRGDFLHPHLDNSHDGDNRLYRVLNILYYASPEWPEGHGGDLELWDEDVRTPTAVPVRFNRLVVMATNATSWHSVNALRGETPRLCVSNYYFSALPPGGVPHSHVTSFAGRPEQPMLRAFMKVDAFAMNMAGRLFPFLTTRNKHRIRDEG